jgi:plasmid maintenance system antidote protein VapI
LTTIKGVRIPKDRAPTPPGEMLLEEFLKPLGMTQVELAERIRVPYVRVNELDVCCVD